MPKSKYTNARLANQLRSRIMGNAEESAETLMRDIREVFGTWQGIPAQRGLWTLASLNASNQVIDGSGQGLHLSNSAPSWAVTSTGITYAGLNGTTAYLYRASEAALNLPWALTVGGWFWFDSLDGTGRGLVTKNDLASNRSWSLSITSTNVQFICDKTGNNTTYTAANAALSLSTGEWYFIVGRFQPSIEVALFVDGEKVASNTTSVIDAMYAGTAALEVGRLGLTNARCLHGRATMLFMSAYPDPDAVVDNLWDVSAPYFGK